MRSCPSLSTHTRTPRFLTCMKSERRRGDARLTVFPLGPPPSPPLPRSSVVLCLFLIIIRTSVRVSVRVWRLGRGIERQRAFISTSEAHPEMLCHRLPAVASSGGMLAHPALPPPLRAPPLSLSLSPSSITRAYAGVHAHGHTSVSVYTAPSVYARAVLSIAPFSSLNFVPLCLRPRLLCVYTSLRSRNIHLPFPSDFFPSPPPSHVHTDGVALSALLCPGFSCLQVADDPGDEGTPQRDITRSSIHALCVGSRQAAPLYPLPVPSRFWW